MGQSCSIGSFGNSHSSPASTPSPKEKKKKSKNPKMAPVVISPSGKHTATLIFCHGLGDTGHGWASTLADVRQGHVKIICPTADTMPVTLNSGMIKFLIFSKLETLKQWFLTFCYKLPFLKIFDFKLTKKKPKNINKNALNLRL